MIRENNANILSLPQMLANNEISNSLILEKITEQEENQNKQLVPKIELKLDVYLHGDNNEQISGPEDI